MRSPKRQTLFFGVSVLAVLSCVAVLTAKRWDRFVGNVPVEFYGRVVNQEGVGIPGVRVTARIRAVKWVSHPLAPRFSERTVTAVTDGQGRFSFRARSGKFLSVGPFEKDGWKPSTKEFRAVENRFEYPLLGYEYPPGARKKPDNPSDPIVYPMVRSATRP